MATLKAKAVESALVKKGFILDNKDHRRFVLYIGGIKQEIRTMLSHNGQEINQYLQSCMARQMCLTKSEFLLFVACKLSGENYIKTLKERGHL